MQLVMARAIIVTERLSAGSSTASDRTVCRLPFAFPLILGLSARFFGALTLKYLLLRGAVLSQDASGKGLLCWHPRCFSPSSSSVSIASQFLHAAP